MSDWERMTPEQKRAWEKTERDIKQGDMLNAGCGIVMALAGLAALVIFVKFIWMLF